MRIRPLATTDRPALESILEESFRADEVAVALELIDAAASGSSDYHVRVAADVAEAPHGVAGYICFGPTPMTRGTFDLYWIVCHPEIRGRGVASALIREMEAELRDRGGNAIRVETSETEGYGAARRLYRRLDYPRAALLADFYAPGDGLIIYYKKL